MSAIATYLTQSGTRRILRCHPCATHFSETRETVFFDLRPSEEKVMMALKMLLVRGDLAGISFVLGVPEETVLAWLRRMAHPAEAINHHLLRALPVTQVQLDEMWNFIERQHAWETDTAGESVPDGEEGRPWVWISFAPECRVMIAAVHVVTTCARTGRRGRPRKPRCAPHPDLIYRQVVKQKQQGTLLTLSTRVVLGAERLRQRVVFFQAFSNVARPHRSWRQPLPLHERTRHGAMCPRWRERTPARAAGVTDHVWTFRELLTAQFEPLDAQSISG